MVNFIGYKQRMDDVLSGVQLTSQTELMFFY